MKLKLQQKFNLGETKLILKIDYLSLIKYEMKSVIFKIQIKQICIKLSIALFTIFDQ
jgi:hypothetical protein